MKAYKGIERRVSLRVSYEPGRRSTLRTGENEFEVADITERGLRFFNPKKIEPGNWIQGTLQLLCGDKIDVEGMVVRKKGIDIYINVNAPIQKEYLIKEQQYIADS